MTYPYSPIYLIQASTNSDKKWQLLQIPITTCYPPHKLLKLLINQHLHRNPALLPQIPHFDPLMLNDPKICIGNIKYNNILLFLTSSFLDNTSPKSIMCRYLIFYYTLLWNILICHSGWWWWWRRLWHYWIVCWLFCWRLWCLLGWLLGFGSYVWLRE